MTDIKTLHPIIESLIKEKIYPIIATNKLSANILITTQFNFFDENFITITPKKFAHQKTIPVDGNNLPIADNSIDHIFLIYSGDYEINHIFLRELWRILKDDGIIIFLAKRRFRICFSKITGLKNININIIASHFQNSLFRLSNLIYALCLPFSFLRNDRLAKLDDKLSKILWFLCAIIIAEFRKDIYMPALAPQKTSFAKKLYRKLRLNKY